MISLFVNDDGNTGMGGPYTAASGINVWVYAGNDAPVATVPGPMNVLSNVDMAVTGDFGI